LTKGIAAIDQRAASFFGHTFDLDVLAAIDRGAAPGAVRQLVTKSNSWPPIKA
jgi:hypothetical protein